jgi:hypothetical protein
MERAMRRTAIALIGALASVPAIGADFEQHWDNVAGLHAGGIGSLYLAYLMFDPENVDIDQPQRFNGGAAGAYAMPISDNASIQVDAAADIALQREGDSDQTMLEGTIAVHLSWRDPSSHLLGAFGGGGLSIDDGDNLGEPIPFYFAGLEGQAYFDRATLQGQVGFLDGDDNWLETIENAYFARAVAHYYVTDRTKLSAEASYLHGGRPNNVPDSGGVIDIYGWGARLDHLFADHGFGMFASYNGYDFRPTEESDHPWVHEFRVGLVKYFGSPSILDNDRYAAGLDLPPASRWISIATNEIE